MKDERFQELLEGFIDKTLTEVSSNELLDAFAAETEFKTRFVDELRIANALHGLAVHDRSTLSRDVTESIQLGDSSPDISEAVIAQLKSKSKPKNLLQFPAVRIALGWAAAIAALLIVGLIPILPTPPPRLATLAHAIDADWADQKSFRDGQHLGPGMIHLESGVARLDFAKGVRVTLEGPAEYELIAPGETRLHSGSLTAHVPPEGIGFQVHTEKVEVTDLGTTFGVAVGKNGTTDVDVFEGEVEVKSVASKEEKIIHEGKTLSMQENSDPLTLTNLKPRDFKPGWNELFGVMNTGGRIRFINAQQVKDPTHVIDRDNIIVFPERFDHVAEKNIEVTLTEPGTYSNREHTDASEKLFIHKRRINTYLLQYNPPHLEGIPNSDQISFEGHVTFDRPILGIITDPKQLLATDDSLGKPRLTYPDHLLRGLEHGDTLTLSEDRKTLTIDWLVMQAIEKGRDQIRVIVDVSDSK